ncbi:hypothetical protein [Spirosoma sp. KNUC1025]|uniref:hypothetical protein n=1 Tax=Spirosoma sp. KNUC1025 TaxID=2894082 RepID=UPI003862DB9C|nr:hypothetical protein LN737_20670 [Spirosoma sp. KNUC1025]
MKYLSFLLVLLSVTVEAQDDYYQKKTPTAQVKPTHIIKLKDGTSIRGELIRQDSTEAVIRTNDLGMFRVRADQVVRVVQINAQAEDEYFPNLFPQTMRFTPTAYSAEKGRVYFRNYFLYFSQFEYGINDNWSVGTTFFSFLPTTLFSLNTKVSLPVSKRVRLGIAAQYVGLQGPDLFVGNTFADAGYVQGIVTTGDRSNNTTFGLGWSISNGDLSSNVVGTFGIVRKVSPKLTFISENVVLFGSGIFDFVGALSGGIRFDRRRHAFDLAAYIPVVIGPRVSSVVTLIPYGSYHLRIGK